MATVNPFQINVSQSVLDDLSSRIRHTRWPETGEDAGWAYGTDPRYLKELLTYWDENYD